MVNMNCFTYLAAKSFPGYTCNQPWGIAIYITQEQSWYWITTLTSCSCLRSHIRLEIENQVEIDIEVWSVIALSNRKTWWCLSFWSDILSHGTSIDILFSLSSIKGQTFSLLLLRICIPSPSWFLSRFYTRVSRPLAAYPLAQTMESLPAAMQNSPAWWQIEFQRTA